MSNKMREALGQAVSDHFKTLDNGDGTFAFDPCSSDDVDALVSAMLAEQPAQGEAVAEKWRTLALRYDEERIAHRDRADAAEAELERTRTAPPAPSEQPAQGKPDGYVVLQRDGSFARAENYASISLTRKVSPDVVFAADINWPENAPHKQRPFWFSPPAPSMPDFWAAVSDDKIIEVSHSTDDGNRGEASRQEVNDWINENDPRLRLVGLYAAPPAPSVPDKWGPWRDVAVHGYPKAAQEVLFVRGGKTVHGAFIGDLFWHSNKPGAASLWMPLPEPLGTDAHRAILAAAPEVKS